MYEKAKAIVIERPGQAEVREIPVAPVDEQTLVVQTTYSAISTGTEMKVWSGLSGHLGGALWYPLVPGYEGVGVVAHVGEKVTGFKVGDRVMANEVRHYPHHCAAWGGQCAWLIKNPKTAPSPFDGPAIIPCNVSDREAVVAYLAAVAKKGFDKTQPREGETVLVIGMGLIGIAWVQLAKRLAGCRVIAMDVHPQRLDLAARYADEVIDARKENPALALNKLTRDRRADVVVECSGNPEVVTELHQYLRDGGWERDDDGGRIHLQGDYPWPLIIRPYQPWFTKNLRISMTCAIRPGGKAEVLQLIAEGKLDLKSILSSPMVKELPVDQAPEGYRMIHESRGNIFKVFLKW